MNGYNVANSVLKEITTCINTVEATKGIIQSYQENNTVKKVTL